MLIHSEYGHHNIDNARSDIVIFDPEDVKSITDPLNLKMGKTKKDYLQPDFIFEFGTEKSTGSDIKFTEHLKNDIKKLNNAKVQGYLIHFQRNIYGKENKEKNKEKIYNYEERVNEINGILLNNKSNIKILIFIINIGNKNNKFFKEGKIKIYKDGKFEAVNRNKIKEEIEKLLNYQEK